jgi:hypothetical protein
MLPSPVSCMKPPLRAPPFSARMALADRAPKLIAEMLKTLAEYGWARAVGVVADLDAEVVARHGEWLIHS